MYETMRKLRKWLFIGTFIGSLFVAIVLVVSILGAVSGAVGGSGANCNTDDTSSSVFSADDSLSSANASVDDFVKKHKEAYMDSWKEAGVLPSFSITQSMQETSFSSAVPSFAQAHNMGGVKWTSKADYPITIKKYGDDAVAGSGPGTTVGDGPGVYTYYKSFDAGILGKAEFLYNNSNYAKAINNTDGHSVIKAVVEGHYAQAPDYQSKLDSLYDSLGKKYEWLDKEAIKKYGEKPVKNPGSKSDSGSSSSDSSDDGSSDSDSSVDFSGAEQWYKDKIGKVTYSMSARTGPNSYDCSSSLYYALTANGASKTSGNAPVSTETEHDWLISNGYEKVYEGKWSSNDDTKDRQEGDVFIWGTKGGSGGGGGHTGLFLNDKEMIHCSASNNGIQKNNYKDYKSKVTSDHGTVYVYRLKNAGSSGLANCSTDDDDSSSSSDGSGSSSDKGGKVPTDAKEWGYKPSDAPSSLKPYIHDPEALGLKYGGPDNWQEHSGQCVDLSQSLGNLIWGHQGIVSSGSGANQAKTWASTIFKNQVKKTPKAGAIFSTPTGGAGAGHTGIVSHVFDDGSILVIEQNSPLSGSQYGQVDTWNYRIISKSDLDNGQYEFAYPDKQEPKWSKQ